MPQSKSKNHRITVVYGDDFKVMDENEVRTNGLPKRDKDSDNEPYHTICCHKCAELFHGATAFAVFVWWYYQHDRTQFQVAVDMAQYRKAFVEMAAMYQKDNSVGVQKIKVWDISFNVVEWEPLTRLLPEIHRKALVDESLFPTMADLGAALDDTADDEVKSDGGAASEPAELDEEDDTGQWKMPAECTSLSVDGDAMLVSGEGTGGYVEGFEQGPTESMDAPGKMNEVEMTQPPNAEESTENDAQPSIMSALREAEARNGD